jgi:hypothetical protein
MAQEPKIKKPTLKKLCLINMFLNIKFDSSKELCSKGGREKSAMMRKN